MSNTAVEHRLDFEQPVYELDDRIAELEKSVGGKSDSVDEISRLRRQRTELLREIYAHLDPWQTVQVARHPDRPQTGDYIHMVFDEFVELHGDRFFGDDRAIMTGWARIADYRIMLIGQHKGRNLKERQACFFGCPHPEGYRKAMLRMRLAEKFHLPVVCLIDTPGAYPGVGAEERGQAYVIAQSMYEMSRLATPVICIVIGEGGSGGALGLGVGDRIAMLEHSYYSVISPEGCAGILWKTREYRAQAARALRMTSGDLPQFGLVDTVLKEPIGGAHRDHHQMAATIKRFLRTTLRELLAEPMDQLLEKRYQKFRAMGVFLESAPEETADVHADVTNEGP
ncbi:MAG: acetyl-CoA carboxylase carboxyltransferase subunit alpha [Planctomycetia bacterium]|nr:acetyl-CoA carboxylase carboxyltransferase subunit alpha [Planctomycetia bacterium]